MGGAMFRCPGAKDSVQKVQQTHGDRYLGDLQALKVQIARLQTIWCEDKGGEIVYGDLYL